jgi:hypothetical protein
VLNAIPYLGKDEEKPLGMQVGHKVITELMKPYYNKGHNITTDNYFTSLSLAKNLQQKGTSLVGTCRWGRRELPKELDSLQEKMTRYDAMLFEDQTQTVTLTLYKSKPRKAVLIMSSQHNSCTVDEAHRRRLPETVAFYNHTKHGVDVCDQMVRLYTTKAQSRRWPVHVFYNILDFAGINSWILFQKASNTRVSRCTFLRGLGEKLGEKMRLSKKGVAPDDLSFNDNTTLPRRKCQISSHYNMTKQVCCKCSRYCCGSCVADKQTTITCCQCFH